MIHILECGHFDDKLKAVSGGDFGDLYKSKLQQAECPAEIAIWDVVKFEYPQIGPGDSVLITGSVADSFSDIDWVLKLVDFVRQLLDQKTRVVGICFGHQIVSRALGCQVGRASGWELGTLPVTPTPLAQRLFPDLGPRPEFYQYHQDEVKQLPAGFELLFQSPKTTVQGYTNSHVLTTQFHPEFDYQIMHSLCDHLDSDTRVEAVGSLKQEHSGMKLMSHISQFLCKA